MTADLLFPPEVCHLERKTRRRLLSGSYLRRLSLGAFAARGSVGAF